jgi:hypothetical protein
MQELKPLASFILTKQVSGSRKVGEREIKFKPLVDWLMEE